MSEMQNLADKYAIGTEHIIDGKTVIVEECDPESPCRPCKGCCFAYEWAFDIYCILPSEFKNGPVTHYPVCYACERTDRKNVIFRRKEQQ